MNIKAIRTHLVLSLSLLASLTGCGGGKTSDGGGGGNTDPTVTSTSVTPNPTSILTTGTSQCNAVVHGNNSPPQTVTWSGSNSVATISASGLVTPTGIVGTATCVATPTLPGYNTSAFSGSANVTITLPVQQPTATMSASPGTINLGQSSSLTYSCTNATLCVISWGTGNNATVPSGTNQTFPVSPTTTTTYTLTATGAAGTNPATATTTVTVNQTPVITVTGPTGPIDTSMNAQFTVAYQNIAPGANWSVSCVASACGSITVSGQYTPPTSVSGPTVVTIAATSTQNSSISGTATITVTEAIPVITGSNTPYIYEDTLQAFQPVSLSVSGFQAADVVACTPNGVLFFYSITSSTQIQLTLKYDDPDYLPGLDTCTVTSSDGNHVATWVIPFNGNHNNSGIGLGGDIFFYGQSDHNVYKYPPAITGGGSFPAPGLNSAAVDDVTGNVVVDGADYDENGNASANPNHSSIPSGTVLASAAHGGYGVFLQPATSTMFSYNLTGGVFANPTVQVQKNFCDQLQEVAMGTFGTETDAFVLCRGTPLLQNVNVSGGLILKGSQTIPAVTPYATIQASNLPLGGWQVAVSDKGPATGLVATLFTYDKKLTFFNASTMSMVYNQITLPGIPFRIAFDQTHGTLVVAFATSTGTTFAVVNPSTGLVTNLTSTTNILANGLQISADGTTIYACSAVVNPTTAPRCQALPNQ